MNKRELGSKWEEQAAAYLQEQGMVIVERNFRTARGEIDLIGLHEKYLVFVEVKYRRDSSKGGPFAAVGLSKQRQICRVADEYRMKKGLTDNTMVRYDVLGIENGSVTWLKNAFPHIYTRG